MELGAELGMRSQTAQQIVAELFRLQRAKPHPIDARYSTADVHRIPQISLPLHAVKGKVDADEHRLPAACLRHLCRLLCQRLPGLGATAPSGVGYDAVGAELVAAVLDLDERPGSVCILRRGQ